MERRELLGCLGLSAAGLLAASATSQAAEDDKLRYKSLLDHTHVECLNACTQCAAVCNEASHHCLEKLGADGSERHHHMKSHHLTMDCAALCSTAAQLVARQSPLMADACNACADGCKRCASECEHDSENAQIMQECVRICRECEKACRTMSQAMAGAHH